MGNFHKERRFGGGDRKRFGGKGGGFGGRPERKFAMNQAICAECGQKCSVPFKPTGDRPVFCDNCFANKGKLNARGFGGDNRGGGFGAENRGGFDRKFDHRDERRSNNMSQAICAECGKSCEVPFKPTGDRPVYCSQCFENQGNSKAGSFSKRDFGGGFEKRANPMSRNTSSAQENFVVLNAKLDQILKLLNPTAFVAKKAAPVEKKVTPAAVKKTETIVEPKKIVKKQVKKAVVKKAVVKKVATKKKK